jgi:hypothetical protein
MTEPFAPARKWTRLEYERLVEAEFLGPEDRIELLGGHMIVKEPRYRSYRAIPATIATPTRSFRR